MLTIIIGKSGSGKDTLREHLTEKEGYEPILSVTTREPREGEKNGVDYFFVDDDTFENLLKTGEIFEYRAYSSSKGTACFGSRVYDLDPDKNYVRVVDPAGAQRYLEVYGRENCFVVDVDVPDGVRYERAFRREGMDKVAKDDPRLEKFQKEWETRLADDTAKFSPSFVREITNFVLDNNRADKESMFMDYKEAFDAYCKAVANAKAIGLTHKIEFSISTKNECESLEK